MSRTRLALALSAVVVAAVAIPTVVMAAATTTPGSFSLSCKVNTSGAVTCNGTLPTSSPTTTTTTMPVTTTTTLPPTTTTTAPSPTTTTTTVAQTNCITGNGQLGPYFDPNIYFSNGNGTTTVVKNQNTGANAGTTETLCDPNKSAERWTVAANMQGRTNVQYFPDLQEVLTTATVQPEGGQGLEVSSFDSLTSSFNTSDPGDANGVWESAYDLWFGNRVGDIMIWEDTSTALASSSYGGAHVVSSDFPLNGQTYTLLDNCAATCAPSTDELMLVRNTTATSGTEDILAAIKALQFVGDIPATTNLAEANFGFEVRGTAGTTENFALNSYSLTQTPASS